jgi:hypothetical protein
MIFTGGESVCWRMRPTAAGKTVEWEVRTRVWVTYWPNKKTQPLHTETRTLEFRELLHLTVAEQAKHSKHSVLKITRVQLEFRIFQFGTI